MGDQLTASEPFFLYEGGMVSEVLKQNLTRVCVAPHVTEISGGAFNRCINLAEVQLNEGLRIIGMSAFVGCTALQSVTLPSSVTELRCNAFCHCFNLAEVHWNEGLRTIGACAFEQCRSLRSAIMPSTVTELGYGAFIACGNLAEVQLNEGLQIIGKSAFFSCWALQSVTIPSTVNELCRWAFYDCGSNLSEMILLGGEGLFNQEFLDRGNFSEEGLLNQVAIREFFFNEDFKREHAYGDCPLDAVKISFSWALAERMARLPHECRVSVEEGIRNLIRDLCRLELMQDGTVLACFPVVSRASDVETEYDSDDEAEEEDKFDIEDTDLETARSVFQVLQLIAFHELRESSILIELAMWKSRIDGAMSVPRGDCRIPIPDPAKSLIMEYGGFAGFLAPVIEGA